MLEFALGNYSLRDLINNTIDKMIKEIINGPPKKGYKEESFPTLKNIN